MCTCQDGVTFDPLKHSCPKACCQRAKCPAHTQCKEMCHAKFKRYICECPRGKTHDCDKLPRTCTDIRNSLGFLPSDGLYSVYDSQDKLFQVYCDFTSEPAFAYTLIESFSFANKGIFTTLGYIKDAPYEQNSFNWNKYRLCKERMQLIASHSSHVRATCNIHKHFSTRDYFRIKLQGFGLFDIFKAQCRRYEYMNIVGNKCSNCTVGTWQVLNEHLHVNPYYSVSLSKCEFGGSASGFPGNFETFGFYNNIDVSFGCCSSASSTTQYWIGSKYH